MKNGRIRFKEFRFFSGGNGQRANNAESDVRSFGHPPDALRELRIMIRRSICRSAVTKEAT